MEEVSACDLVEHTPDFCLSVERNVSRCCSAYGSSLEIEAQPITLNTADPPFDGAHFPSLVEDAVIHVGAEREVPNLILWLACEDNPVPSIVQCR